MGNIISYDPEVRFSYNHNRSHEEVPISKIKSSQKTLSVSEVKRKIDDVSTEYQFEPEFSYNKHHDLYHIDDGNHRTAAARLLGNKTIKGTVWK